MVQLLTNIGSISIIPKKRWRKNDRLIAVVSNSGFPDDADNQGDEVDDQAIQDRNKAHLDASGNDVACYVIMAGQEIDDLQPAQNGPEYTNYQCADANFFYPGRCFPGREEETDEQEGDDDHANGTAGHEKGE